MTNQPGDIISDIISDIINDIISDIISDISSGRDARELSQQGGGPRSRPRSAPKTSASLEQGTLTPRPAPGNACLLGARDRDRGSTNLQWLARARRVVFIGNSPLWQCRNLKFSRAHFARRLVFIREFPFAAV